MKNTRQIFKVGMASLLIALSASVHSQSLNPKWDTDLKKLLEQFLTCQSTQGGKGCTEFLGESLKTVYTVNDFYSAKHGRYMTASEISIYLKDTKQWSLLGHAYEQSILTKAQDHANSKKAVVAVYMNDDGIGHVVIITPGQLQSSGSWGLSVPNVASFFSTQPEKSFVDKSLSFAFSKAMLKDILIYVRN